MHTKLSHLALATVILAVACSPQDEQRVEAAAETAAEETQEAVETAATEAKQAIMELERTWSQKVAEKDTAWIAARHAANARTMPPNAEPVVGRDAIAAWWGDMVGTEGLEISWEPAEAHVSGSGDMAYDVGTYEMTLPDGSTDSGKYLVVWVKEGGEWKIAADMFSSNQPPPGSS